MTKQKHKYEQGKRYLVKNSKRFKACIEYLDTEDDDDIFHSCLTYGDITDNIVIIFEGLSTQGQAIFKMVVGEIWRKSIIVTNINPQDHPLNIGLENYIDPQLAILTPKLPTP